MNETQQKQYELKRRRKNNEKGGITMKEHEMSYKANKKQEKEMNVMEKHDMTKTECNSSKAVTSDKRITKLQHQN